MSILPIEQVFRELLASNRGPGYSISVTDVSDDLSSIAVTVRFVAGRTYCCAEAFCHVPQKLSRLIRLAARRGVVFPPYLCVRWHFVIEAGARLECLTDLGLPPESVHYEFDEVSPPSRAGTMGTC